MKDSTKNLISKTAAIFSIVSFFFTPVLPTLEVFAQSKALEVMEIPIDMTVEIVPVAEIPVSPNNVIAPKIQPAIEADLAESVQKIKETLVPAIVIKEPVSEILSKTKFKKNSSLSVEQQLALVRKHIIANNLPKAALDRLDQFENEQKSMAQTGLAEEIPSDTALNKSPFEVETFNGKIQTRDASEYEKDFASANIRRPRGAVNQDPSNYLAEGNEIKFSQAIKDQADALEGDPLKILNFIRNNIEYVPYFGSKKGADATLIEKAGNDMDKAALLIAMLRYKNIPARYHHANVKMDIRTVTDLLGVETADAATEILAFNDIPVQLYTLNGEPHFFVIDHVFVEAYIPYGYSRGADLNDGGTEQWVPIDPTINSYYYEQLVDVVDHIKSNGFAVEDFFETYLNGNFNTQEPIDAFKEVVAQKLGENPPQYYPNLTYDDSLTHFYPKIQNLEFIPGSLPYSISSDIGTHAFVPSIYRHTLKFTVKDKNGIEVLNHTAFMSDIADRELLITYDPTTSEDQTIIDSFDTIYDVVPLSLVSVKPVIKVNGQAIAIGNTSATLGQKQKYILEWSIPNGGIIGDPILSKITKTYEKDTIAGNSEAIALNTDRVIPSELRPREDTQTSSFISNQLLYSIALDYLNRLQSSHDELAKIIGGGFIHRATKASVFNGIQITNNNGQPYSFEWKGLRVDSLSSVKYFNRFHSDINTYKREFTALFGLQASQDESDIFEDNFDVESVATVKGLKKVSHGDFSGVSMKKITSANESEINSLDISASTKAVFHQAIADGRIIYTPTKPVTYGTWTGLFYITIDFAGGDASYTIGEGLNGGYTVVEQWPEGLANLWRRTLLTIGLTAQIVKPLNNQEFMEGDIIKWEARYTSPIHSWIEKLDLFTNQAKIGWNTLQSGYGTNQSVKIKIKEGTTATMIECSSVLDGYSIPATSGKIGEEMHIPLTIDKNSGVYSNRFNGYIQYNKQDDIYSHPTSQEFFTELKGSAMTINNINNPWIDPSTGKYWNMSVDYAAFGKPAKSIDHEKYYMNMRWDYSTFAEKDWHFGKKVWIKNPATKKAIIAGILEYGPHVTTGRVAGASPEVLKMIGAKTDSELEYCWAIDQNLSYGTKLNY